MTSHAAEREVVLEGDLARFPIVEVLQLLELSQASGRLEIERSGERGEVEIAAGRPVRGSTSLGSVRLGEALLHRGGVTPDTLDRALADQERSGESLGGLLVRHGAPPADVIQGLNDVLRRILFGFMLWESGRFRFVPAPEGPREDLAPDLELDALLLANPRSLDLPGEPFVTSP